MKGLLKKLPPFAPDYSGVSSLFYTLGGAIIINGADGCIGNVTGYDEPRFFDHDSYIFSSGLKETHAITGDEDVLRSKIEDSLEKEDLNFIVILGTPTSAVIASDHESVTTLLSRGREIPVFTVNTTGIDCYEKGLSRAFDALARKADFYPPLSEPSEDLSVNIVGATPLDFWGMEQAGEIRDSLEKRGIRVNGCWGMDNSWESVRKSLQAQMNLIVAASALRGARYMKKHHGIPFICGVPLARFAEALTEEIRGKGSGQPAIMALKPGRGQRLVLLGEQLWSCSLRQALLLENPDLDIRCISFFKQEPSLKMEGDLVLQEEDDLTEYVNREKPTLVIGDPLYRRLTCDTPFYGIPHLAVSSRLYWNHDTPYTGDAMDLNEILKRL
ncbi:MAG: nitrogenase component 1 [Spirochaetales bacterium]|nr:nitrogenase component 1 [Spirochaetales bacterium]